MVPRVVTGNFCFNFFNLEWPRRNITPTTLPLLSQNFEITLDSPRSATLIINIREVYKLTPLKLNRTLKSEKKRTISKSCIDCLAGNLKKNWEFRSKKRAKQKTKNGKENISYFWHGYSSPSLELSPSYNSVKSEKKKHNLRKPDHCHKSLKPHTNVVVFLIFILNGVILFV